MKELEKIKRISIASTLFILAVLIGVLTFERPKNMYAFNTENTLETLTTTSYLISMDEIDKKNSVLIDVRSQYEYEKGHLENAINMASPEILTQENQLILNDLKDDKTMVVYGENVQEANIPFLMLYQLGFTNLKLLSVKLDYLQNKLIVSKEEVEKPASNIKDFINESIKNSKKPIVVEKVKAEPKRVITVQKKKKKPVEGGC
ncbi:rhodanese-like domain-containing protein [Yeosuana sp. AK3]